MIGQLAAAIVAVPAGRLSDGLGRKPMMYASCLLMGIVYSGFACAPSINTVLGLGVAYGIGNGTGSLMRLHERYNCLSCVFLFHVSRGVHNAQLLAPPVS